MYVVTVCAMYLCGILSHYRECLRLTHTAREFERQHGLGFLLDDAKFVSVNLFHFIPIRNMYLC